MKTKKILWLLILIISMASCSKKPKIKTQTSVEYTYAKKFGEYVEVNPKYKDIYEYNVKGLIESFTRLKFERDSWEIYSKKIYVNDSVYSYDKQGQLDTIYYHKWYIIKPKKLKNNVLLYHNKSDSVKIFRFLNSDGISYKDSTIYKDGGYCICNCNVLEVDENKKFLKYIYGAKNYYKINYKEPLDSLSFIEQRYSWSEETYDEYLKDIEEHNSKIGEYKSYGKDTYLVKVSYEYW